MEGYTGLSSQNPNSWLCPCTFWDYLSSHCCDSLPTVVPEIWLGSQSFNGSRDHEHSTFRKRLLSYAETWYSLRVYKIRQLWLQSFQKYDWDCQILNGSPDAVMLTKPLSGMLCHASELGLTMTNLFTKFEVFISTRYENRRKI